MTKENLLRYGKEYLHDLETACCEIGELHLNFVRESIKALEQEPCTDMGEVSDGYHTFNQLYHQRAVLFATIVNEHLDISWKSFKHFDGHYCFDEDGEMFIVGIGTPEGSYTYHYHKKYWDLFKCKELERGKEWDGHTEKDVTRLLSLKREPCNDCVSRQAVIDMTGLSEWFDSSDSYNEFVITLSELPPVTPQPKTAHWILTMPRGAEEWSYKCSKCGFWKYEKTINLSKFKFCPSCGAIMVESQESESERMRIEKTECNYQVTECDLKFGEQITLDGELLIPISVLNKIKAEIENHCGLTKENHCRYCSYCNILMGVREILEIIDKYRTEREVKE